MKRSSGFTLIEVLVAIAIVGIALGVILSSIAMGHREAFRGDQAREAAEIAGDILRDLGDGGGSITAGSGKVEGHPGWSYSIVVRDAAVTLQNEDMGEKDLDTPGLVEVVLKIFPPGNGAPFVLASLMQSADQPSPGAQAPFAGGLN
ncbi:MAG: type II secretion system protein [Dissulfurimicrobium sp.]|uniref:type II secretion system protein n=1 Tax=Dissulfurimicrobium TaxID=1769732 RepID=UPI001EDA5AA3|nr:type II secretion system protein [Dissulfurimicrobium hydrothermale]UKL13995.1 type II secretion system GspH family protein [Dissulfurimicrobium hydrothermale]